VSPAGVTVPELSPTPAAVALRTRNIALGLGVPMPPRSWKLVCPGKRMWTVAAYVGGRMVSGRRKMTRWFIEEGCGRVKMNCVSDTVRRLAWTVVLFRHGGESG
jgi:hypothetical protein